jgi:hypothetical protein
MNRLLKVFLALSLPVLAVLVVLLNTRSEQPDLRQQAVLSYVFFKHTTMTQPLAIGQYAQASMPQNFRAALSQDSFGNATYYQTAHRYDQTAQPNLTFPLTATMPPTLTRSSYLSGMPIPYPPTDLWCVQLFSPDPAAPKVVLAALHQDIYNAEWIVHEVSDPAAVLPAIGCKFAAQ